MPCSMLDAVWGLAAPLRSPHVRGPGESLYPLSRFAPPGSFLAEGTVAAVGVGVCTDSKV